MWSWLPSRSEQSQRGRLNLGPAPTRPPPGQGPGHSDTEAALTQTIHAVGQLASRVGQDAAELRGQIEDATQGGVQGARAVQALGQQVQAVQAAQTEIARDTQACQEAVVQARRTVDEVAAEVQAMVDALKAVSEVASDISRIALQTRLVAFNASVEAGRAGEAGRGFAVVADSVKALSGQVEASSKHILRTLGSLGERVQALSADIHSDPRGLHHGRVQQALVHIEHSIHSMGGSAASSQSICLQLTQQMDTIERDIQTSVRTLTQANQRAEAFLKAGESLIEMVADCGVETADTPYIRAAQSAASQLSRLLEQALADGQLSPTELWDEQYRPVQGSQPAQVLSSINAFSDRHFPAVQEPWLQALPGVVFCIASDRNGYVPTHNSRYCQTQRPGDLTWNTANSRWRRIFNDRTGLASARNTRPFLLQTYRRDMGGGRFVLLKEAAAPIVVQGRHWGGLRLAFEF